MNYIIENEEIKVTVASHGAEIISVIKKDENRECIWSADPAAWNRHAPVLFPFVGRCKDNKFTFAGKEYAMKQHGFARDKEFELAEKTDSSLVFVLKSDADTLKDYPFEFEFTCGFEIVGSVVKVSWKVYNANNSMMYFSLGGHPGFVGRKSSLTGAKLVFENKDQFTYGLINDDGYFVHKEHVMKLDDGKLDIDEHLFDKDALIIEGEQGHVISIVEDGKRLVTLRHACPLVGIWAAAGKNNPFVCIEPWYGRVDAEDFEGELQDREFGNALPPHLTFSDGYEMEF